VWQLRLEAVPFAALAACWAACAPPAVAATSGPSLQDPAPGSAYPFSDEVTARGVTIAVTCPAPASQTCSGAVTLSSTEHLKSKRVVRLSARSSVTRRVTVGETAFTMGAGQSERISVTLNRTGRGLLGRFGRLPVTVTVSVTGVAGGAPSTVHNMLLITAVDTVRVARAIEGSILAQRHIHAKVTCPSVVIERQGNTFRCFATTVIGKGKHQTRSRTPFKVIQENGEGEITYVGE
jgi:hypothetical protein